MSRLGLMIIGIAVAICGCDSAQGPQNPAPPNPPPASGSSTAPANGTEVTPAKEPAPDNSAVNQRDREPDAKTPIDQSEEPGDIKVTSDIRKRIMEQPKFSINAQNVKIMTENGNVTLRGPVATDAEKETIDKIAHDVAGDGKVDNQLEVTP